MSRDIKTREVKKDIKFLDKPAIAAERMRTAYIRAKEEMPQLATKEEAQKNPGQYAEDTVTTSTDRAANKAAHAGKQQAKKLGNKAKEKRELRREQESAAQNTVGAGYGNDSGGEYAQPESAATPEQRQQAMRRAAPRSTAQEQASRRTVSRSETQGVDNHTGAPNTSKIKQREPTEKGIKQSPRGIKTPEKGAVRTAQKSVKTAENTSHVSIKTTHHVAAASRQSANAAEKAAKTVVQASKSAAKTATKSAKAAVKRTNAMVKAAIAAAKGLVTSIAAGGAGAAVIIVAMGLITILVSSPYGILFSSGETSEDTMPLSAVKGQTQAQYNTRIASIESSVSHDAVIRHGEMPDFVEVVAVFAVLTTTREGDHATDVVTIDEDRAQRLIQVFWDMCELTYEVVTHTSESVNEAGETVTVESSVLHITTTPKTYEDIPDLYSFSHEQRELLYELMESRDLLAAVIGESGWYTGSAANINMTDAELYELAAYYGVTLPEALSIERKNVLAAAFAGVQINIPYHYDWRSYYKVYPGIDGNDFGSAVTADYKGRDRKGLDCSAFVGWAYYTGGITWPDFGYGESGGAWSFLATPGMRGVSAMTQIEASDLMPGDIGFISNSAAGTDDHTGIYLGMTSSGTRLWLHCAGSSGAICSTSGFGVFYTVSGMDQTFGERKVSGTIGDSDALLLAQLIFYEGRGYNSFAKELIAQVAANRVNSSKFPSTLTEVLQQPGQYGYGRPDMTGDLIFNADITQHREFSEDLWQKCLTAAQRVADGNSRDENGNVWPSNVLFQHSFSDPEALGPLFKSYSSGGYTEYFCFG